MVRVYVVQTPVRPVPPAKGNGYGAGPEIHPVLHVRNNRCDLVSGREIFTAQISPGFYHQLKVSSEEDSARALKIPHSLPGSLVKGYVRIVIVQETRELRKDLAVQRRKIGGPNVGGRLRVVKVDLGICGCISGGSFQRPSRVVQRTVYLERYRAASSDPAGSRVAAGGSKSEGVVVGAYVSAELSCAGIANGR